MADKASIEVINDDQVAENNQALRDLLRLATQSLPLEEILGNCLDVLLSLRWLSFLPKAGIFLTKKDMDGATLLHLVAERNLGNQIKILCSKIEFGYCLCGKAAQTKRVIHASCIDKNHAITFEGMTAHGHYNVPILLKGHVLGVIVFYLPHGTKRKDEEVHFLERVADTLSLIISVRKTEKELNDKIQELTFQSQAVDEHLMVSTTDVKGIITEVNDMFCAFTGYTREALLGQNHRIIKSDHHSKEFYRNMWDTISNGQIWHGDICNRKKDGSEYWVKSSIVPFLDGRGKPYKYVASRTDITGLRAREERLHNSHIFAKMGTWSWDIKTGEMIWSDLAGPLLGFGEGVTGSTNVEFLAQIHDEDRGMVIKLVNKCITDGIDYTAEYRVVWPDGSSHWIQSNGNVIRNTAGDPLHMLGMIQDINKRKCAELALYKTKKELNEKVRELTFHKYAMDEHAIVSMADYKGDIIYANDKFCNISGYAREELMGQNHRMLKTDEQSTEFFEELWGIVSTGKVWHGEIKDKKKDGGYYWTNATIVPFLNEQGRPFQYAVMRTNVTERKRAEEAAEKANQAKSEFLSSMSHELRTPMNSIMGFGQILESNSREPLTDTQTKCVQRMMKSGEHLLELINQVLNLSEIEAGHMKLSIENVNLEGVIQECLSLISPVADKYNISVHTASFSNMFIKADFIRLKQVILNLLSNAVKYNREDGRVDLHVAQDGDKVRISVSDTGIGIPEGRQHELFQPFSRLGAESSEVEGTGIGLNITRKIVEIMGGTIGFESIIDEGSSFWVELPIAKKQPSMDKIIPQGKEFYSTDKNIHGRILYIEDNPDNLELMEMIVGRMDGLSMLSAHSAELGLDLAVSEQPGLIILDINLPGMDGFEAVRHLKDNEKIKDIPVIALSANAMPRDIEKGKEYGFIHYLTKPINIDEMTSVIIELFEGKGV